MLLLLTTLAFAQATPEAPELDEDETALAGHVPRAAPQAGMEITVYGEMEVGKARKALNQQLIDLGYVPRQSKGGRTVYVHEDGWRQKLVVDDDGHVYFRQRAPHFANQAGVKFNFGSIPRNPRLKLQDKEQALVASQDELVRYGDALAGEALLVRLYEEVPDLLDAIWLEGKHLEQPGLTLPDAVSRRKAILQFWISRTDNPYGDAVREVVEAYMVYVINDSSEPFTDEEIAWANATRRCERPLVLWEY